MICFSFCYFSNFNSVLIIITKISENINFRTCICSNNRASKVTLLASNNLMVCEDSFPILCGRIAIHLTLVRHMFDYLWTCTIIYSSQINSTKQNHVKKQTTFYGFKQRTNLFFRDIWLQFPQEWDPLSLAQWRIWRPETTHILHQTHKTVSQLPTVPAKQSHVSQTPQLTNLF